MSRSLARHGHHHFQFSTQGGGLSIRFGGADGGGGGASQTLSQRTMAVTMMMRQPYVAAHLRTIRVTLDVGVAAAAKRRARRLVRNERTALGVGARSGGGGDDAERGESAYAPLAARRAAAVLRVQQYETDEERKALAGWRVTGGGGRSNGYTLFDQLGARLAEVPLSAMRRASRLFKASV